MKAFERADRKSFLLSVPAERIRAIGFSGVDGNNPFVLTLRDYAAGRCTSFKGSRLEDYYRFWQPHAVGHQSQVISPGPPWKTVRPKRQNSAVGRLERREFRGIARELGVPLSEIHGHISGGPVTEAFGEITFRRFARLYDSMAASGFRPDAHAASYPSGMCFCRGSDYRVVVSSGKHRVTVMLAMGWKEIPVEFGPPKLPVITRREEVDSWPNVLSGHYSREEALRLFDALFAASHPSAWKPATRV